MESNILVFVLPNGEEIERGKGMLATNDWRKMGWRIKEGQGYDEDGNPNGQAAAGAAQTTSAVEQVLTAQNESPAATEQEEGFQTFEEEPAITEVKESPAATGKKKGSK